jgi:hypothetical protein
MASTNGDALSKEEGQVQTLMTAFSSSSGYDTVKPVLAKSLGNVMTAQNFAKMQQQVKQNFGNQKEMKLAALEKFDQGDRLTYIMSYSNNTIVRLVVIFGPNGRDGIRSFTFAPMQVKQEKK